MSSARVLFPGRWLVCFAVKQEARGFTPPDAEVQLVITGMGRANAEGALRPALQQIKPGLVLSCGFAGGLDPNLARGTVLFADDSDPRLCPFLIAAGARAAKFTCSDRVASTAAEKRRMRETTGADAVEMESGHICRLCREQGISSATVRVVLDTADEDLPLDFNRLMTPDYRVNGRRLALALLKSPVKITALARLKNQTTIAARTLGHVLAKLSAKEIL